MGTTRHKVFNLSAIIIPWLSMVFVGKRDFKRYWLAAFFIFVFEVMNHVYGHKKKFWQFYEKKPFFIRDELPFDIGPYIPISIWILKYSYGNFKKFVLINGVANALFAFVGIPLLSRLRIIRLNRLNHLQFFIYIHYKAYLLYGVQYLINKLRA